MKTNLSGFRMSSQRAALVKALLDGKTLSIMNGFTTIGCTNVPRECGRAIQNPETGFGAKLEIKKITTKTQYGTPCYYYTYKLERSEANKPAIEKMKAYLAESNLRPVENKPDVKQNFIRQDLFS